MQLSNTKLIYNKINDLYNQIIQFFNYIEDRLNSLVSIDRLGIDIS